MGVIVLIDIQRFENNKRPFNKFSIFLLHKGYTASNSFVYISFNIVACLFKYIFIYKHTYICKLPIYCYTIIKLTQNKLR